MRAHFAKIIFLTALLSASLSIAACQPALSPVSINDIPVYPGAVEIQPGESSATDDEAQATMQRDAADRNGGKVLIAHKRFRLPKSWETTELMSFYSDALKTAGWSSRWGSVPARQAFDRGSQMLVIYVLVDQKTGEPELLMTLDE